MLLLSLFQVPGGDVAGVVVEADPTSKFQAGSKVFALTDGFMFTKRHGTYCDFASIPEAHLALAPSSLSFEEAAALPLVSLTAMQALDLTHLAQGQRVLIHSGSGGVGSMAVQLAKAQGLHVTSTCSTRNVDFVKSLGADAVVDYTKDKFEEVCKDQPFDAVVDMIGGDYERRGWKVLKKKGTYVGIFTGKTSPGAILGMVGSIVGSKVKSSLGLGPKYTTMLVHPSGQQLEKLAAMVDAGQVKPVIDRVLPLVSAADAHAYAEQGHARGKVVLKVTE